MENCCSSSGSNNNYNTTSSSSGSNYKINNDNNSVPEFAHLSVDATPARSPIPAKSPRRSLERQTPPLPIDSPVSASSSTFRRYERTPILRVGQADDHGDAGRTHDEAPIVELKPDQYKPPSPLDLRRSREEQPPDAIPRRRRREEGEEQQQEAEGRQNDAETRQASVDAIRGAILRRAPVQPSSPPPPPPPTTLPPPPPTVPPPRIPTSTGPDLEQPEGSPTSDGTLVAFEEDAIYFKPVSYSPEALSPILEGGDNDDYYPSYTFHNPATRTTKQTTPSSPPSPLPRPDILSLQIAMDLLTRELSSAVSNESLRAPADVRSLQVWVMIEAYERLRDQVLGMEREDGGDMPAEEARALRGMFNMWLWALYRVHDRLRECSRGPSEVEVQALQMEELD
ncbi:hypothetical protein SLS53_001556 [Cytospora paraplurivora]|uniref:Uncharacterized protein n=1 Tax=Cytospora paraplurivora TaxID=2898453 RepID=A0AAN9YJE1_9PEZI